MSDIQEETRIQMRRSLDQEFGRMEDDFDTTRNHRKRLTDKLVEVASSVVLVDNRDDGTATIREDTTTGVSLITAALKALSDTEKATSSSIGLKMRRSEQEAAASAMHHDRIMVVLEATQPGRINAGIAPERLEEKLAEMFDDDIKSFELKTSPNDIAD